MPPEDPFVRYSAMNIRVAQAWDARVARVLTKLPKRMQDAVAWLRNPSRKPIRMLASVLLIIGSIFSILPILGLWMLPLGLALLSDDFPSLKVWLERTAQWIGRTWRRVRGRTVP
jgi:hypothetical protein